MIRALAGFAAFNVMLIALGGALLFACGLVSPRLRALPGALAAALLVGAATVGMAGSALLTAGGTLTLPPLLAGAVVAVVVIAAVGWRRWSRAPWADPPPAWDDERADRAAYVLIGGAVVLFVLVEAVSSRHLAPAWDAAHNWTLKALALSTGGLDGDVFTGSGAFSGSHLDYPILQPVLGGLLFRFSANGSQGILTGELWLLCGSLVLAAPFLARLARRRWLAMLPYAFVIALPVSYGVLRGDADMTVATFLGAGALALGTWIGGGPSGLAVVAAIMLGAAANTKNEGTVFGVAILIAAALVLAATRPRRLLGLAGVAGFAVLLSAPWRIWVAVHGPFGSDVTPLSTSLHWSFLSQRFPVLDFAAQTMLGQFDAARWLMPGFAAVAIALLAVRRLRALAAFYLAAVTLSTFALLWVYWTTLQPDWAGHIQRTSARTVSGLLFVAASGLAHLLPLGVGEAGERPARASGRARVSAPAEPVRRA